MNFACRTCKYRGPEPKCPRCHKPNGVYYDSQQEQMAVETTYEAFLHSDDLLYKKPPMEDRPYLEMLAKRQMLKIKDPTHVYKISNPIWDAIGYNILLRHC